MHSAERRCRTARSQVRLVQSAAMWRRCRGDPRRFMHAAEAVGSQRMRKEGGVRLPPVADVGSLLAVAGTCEEDTIPSCQVRLQ